MRLEEMPGYSLPTLAVWPQPWYEVGRWQMYDLKFQDDTSLKWYKSFVQTESGHVKAEVYDNYSLAKIAAEERNKGLNTVVEQIHLTQIERDSLRLKVEKAVVRQSRLFGEEELMLLEGKRRNKSYPKPNEKEIFLPPNSQALLPPLLALLRDMPYLRFVRLKHHGVSLKRTGDSDWSTKIKDNKQTAKYFYREQIASAYQMKGECHWGKTKAKIRKLLLPQANKLLQLASVKRMLLEAELKGNKVVVASGFVFWFEDNEDIGWVVKEASYSKADENGNTLWKTGNILSKNHGRIVVLPYVKENGECVQGHTKNAPFDGKAIPRHPNGYVQLPYEILEDDLMIGLFGELKYD
ncbi:hypothetical protein KCU29_002834 [Vibrio parahaemolyticus]|nr:hypothetical protein [Vibrio parahaemolyticus]